MTSLAECINCEKERTTGGRDGQTSKQACMCRASDEDEDDAGYFKNNTGGCVACPLGAACNSHGIPLINISAIEGFWRPDPATFDPTWDSDKSSMLFVDCAKGIYPGANGPALAAARCCPYDKCAKPYDKHPDQQVRFLIIY